MKNIIDINCDMGEGLNNEELFMPYITSCNIACGGHAGTPETMKRVVELALKHGVKIGAHPSYPDKENFGRKPMKIDPHTLKESITWQIDSLNTVVTQAGGKLNHIKPHGALYNEVAEDMDLAKIFFEAIHMYKDTCELYILSNSFAASLARQHGFKIKEEAYADRNYNKDLSLVSRAHDNAILTSPEEVMSHITSMLNGKVKTIDNFYAPIKADTFCVHSDTPNADLLIKVLNEKLLKSGYSVG